MVDVWFYMKFFEKTFLNLGERWRIRLPASEELLQQRLNAIEEKKQDEFPFPLKYCLKEIHIEQCERMKEDLERAYRLRETSIAELQEAVTDFQNKIKWNKAYQVAEEADRAIISYLKGNLHSVVMCYQIGFGFLAAIATDVSLLATTNDIKLAAVSAIAVFMSILIFTELSFYCYAEQITSKFVPHLTLNVLKAADEVGIEIEQQQPQHEHALETENSSQHSSITRPLLV